MRKGYDPELALHQRIAVILDEPRWYMLGPSQHSLIKARKVVDALRSDAGLLGQIASPQGVPLSAEGPQS